ncbi:hypothetical protein PIB30_088589 [Stylosanthes scabra]|uniref:Uncharacterized protein n=1 Tax=Stylosanthes scabra TaxID=79078 RepID=A0ABU6TWN3_9FABA|nr:hypothetical protein [Stylosanthes scabra]
MDFDIGNLGTYEFLSESASQTMRWSVHSTLIHYYSLSLATSQQRHDDVPLSRNSHLSLTGDPTESSRSAFLCFDLPFSFQIYFTNPTHRPFALPSTSHRRSPWWTSFVLAGHLVSQVTRLTTGSRLLQHRENHCAATTVLADSNPGQPRAATMVLAVTPFAVFSSSSPL